MIGDIKAPYGMNTFMNDYSNSSKTSSITEVNLLDVEKTYWRIYFSK